MSSLRRALPRSWVWAARRVAARARAPLYRGDAVECPCCSGRFRRFLRGGMGGRAAARCPGCDSLERHRLLWLYLDERTDLYEKPHRVLHVAPEARLAKRLAAAPNLEYRSADLDSPLAQERLDVTDIPYPDGHFDVVICCHVLEHVPDDRRAMRELRRVLAPGGWAILQTPLRKKLETTQEDPRVTDPAERERLYGQADHVRLYGRDYWDRLAEAGFQVTRDQWAKEMDAAKAERFGLKRGEEMTFCR